MMGTGIVLLFEGGLKGNPPGEAKESPSEGVVVAQEAVALEVLDSVVVVVVAAHEGAVSVEEGPVVGAPGEGALEVEDRVEGISGEEVLAGAEVLPGDPK